MSNGLQDKDKDIVVFTAFIKPGGFQGRDQEQVNNRCRFSAKTGENQTKTQQKNSHEAVTKVIQSVKGSTIHRRRRLEPEHKEGPEERQQRQGGLKPADQLTEKCAESALSVRH